MNQVKTLGERLSEERDRLGHSQTAFAELVGVTKHTVLNWEKDVGAPDARALGIWSEHGLDVTYVVQEKRSIKKANTLYETSLLVQAIDSATTGTAVGESIREHYNALYQAAAKKGIQPGAPLTAGEQQVLDGYRLAAADGKRSFERLAQLEIERKALIDQSHKGQSFSGISITGDGNTVGSGNQANNKKTRVKKS